MIRLPGTLLRQLNSAFRWSKQPLPREAHKTAQASQKKAGYARRILLLTILLSLSLLSLASCVDQQARHSNRQTDQFISPIPIATHTILFSADKALGHLYIYDRTTARCQEVEARGTVSIAPGCWAQLQLEPGSHPDLSTIGDSQNHIEKIVAADTFLQNSDLHCLAPLKGLRELDLSATDITDEGLHWLAPLQHLTRLSLDNTYVAGNGIKDLPVSLTSLDISNVPEVISKQLSRSLFRLRNLDTLRIVNVPLDSDLLSAIASLHNLRYLFASTDGVTPEQLKKLSDCQEMIAISLLSNKWHARQFDFLKKLPHLTGLTLSSKFDDDDAKMVSQLPRLSSISIRPSLKPKLPLSDRGLSFLANAPSLQRLDVFGGSFGNTGIEELARKELIRLQLCPAPVDDQCAAILASNKTLQDLSLPMSGITDRGLLKLSEISTLRALHVGPLVTVNGAETFRKQRPNCQFDLVPYGQNITPFSDEPPKSKVIHFPRGNSLGYLEIRFPRWSYTELASGDVIVPNDARVCWSLDQNCSLNAAVINPSLCAISSVRVENPTFSDSDLLKISQIRSLVDLNLTNTSITDSGLRALSDLHHLRSVNLSNTNIQGDGLSYLPPSVCVLLLNSLEHADLEQLNRAFPKLSQLCSLSVANLTIDNKTLSNICRSLPNLCTLDLTHSTVTDEAMADLARLPLLNDIILTETSIRGSGLKTLPSELTDLQLASTHLNPHDLAVNLPRFSNLQALSLCHSPIDEEVARAIAGSRTLNSLWITEDTGTPSVLSILSKCKNLEHVHCWLDKNHLHQYQFIAALPHLVELSCSSLQWDENDTNFLTRLANLITLNLDYTPIKDTFQSGLSSLQNLRMLSLASSTVSDGSVQVLARLPLNTLLLQQTQTGDLGVSALANNSTLQELNLMRTRISDRGLLRLATAPHLQWLNVEDTQTTANSFQRFEQLARHCRLQHSPPGFVINFPPRAIGQLLIDRTGTHEHVAAEGLVSVPRVANITLVLRKGMRPDLSKVDASYNCIRTLEARDSLLNDADLHQVGQIRSLATLDLVGTDVTDNGLKQLTSLPQLNELNLAYTLVRGKGLPYLPRSLQVLNLTSLQKVDLSQLAAAILKLSKLTDLTLGQTAVDDRVLEAIGRLKNLRALPALNCAHVTPNGLRKLLSCEELNNLTVFNCPFHFAQSFADAKLPPLTSLSWIGSTWNRADTFSLLAARDLNTLDLTESKIEPGALEPIAKLPHLTTLSLNRSTITDSEIVNVIRAKTLQALYLSDTAFSPQGLRGLSGMQLKSLNLSGTRIDDRTISEIAANYSLESLQLERTQITNQGLLKLTSLPYLKELNVGSTDVSLTTVKEFRRLRPHCLITY